MFSQIFYILYHKLVCSLFFLNILIIFILKTFIKLLISPPDLLLMTELWANYFVVLSVFLFVVYVIIIDTNEESTIKLNKVAQIDYFYLFIFVLKWLVMVVIKTRLKISIKAKIDSLYSWYVCLLGDHLQLYKISNRHYGSAN